MTTPVLAIEELTSMQKSKEVTANDAFRKLEQFAMRAGRIKDKDLATPPGSPAEGDAYIIASSPTGAWAGKAKYITYYAGGTWYFVPPIQYLFAYVIDEGVDYTYNGSSWVLASTGEANTASNVNVGGVGVFKQKTGVNLEFRGINAGSSKLTVTLDAGNNEIDLDVAQANIDHDALTNFVADEHVAHSSVSISAGTGLTGGGTITTNRTISMSHLGLQSLTDPNADRIMFWDDSAGSLQWLTVGSGLSISTTTITATGGGDAGTLDSLDSTQFIRSDVNDQVDGTLTFANAGGVAFYLNNDVAIGVKTSAGGSFAPAIEMSSSDVLQFNNFASGGDIHMAPNGAFKIFTDGSERGRTTTGGLFLIGKTGSDEAVAGIEMEGGTGAGKLIVTMVSSNPVIVNRETDDGQLVNFKQDAISEGNISVSGGTVSYNGGHLGRWSQLPGAPQIRIDISLGTVMSAVSEKCQWWQEVAPKYHQPMDTYKVRQYIDGRALRLQRLCQGPEDKIWIDSIVREERNAVLMRSQISTEYLDHRVYGIFDRWDDEASTKYDSEWLCDFYVAVAGDFPIRVTGPCWIGDLLVSNGDGTAIRLDPDEPMTARRYAAVIAKVSQDFPDVPVGVENPELVPAQLMVH